MLKPYQVRVLVELEYLAEKIESLDTISGNNWYAEVPRNEKDLLRQQLHLMKEYKNVLKKRVALYK